jgi:hypothetical protein
MKGDYGCEQRQWVREKDAIEANGAGTSRVLKTVRSGPVWFTVPYDLWFMILHGPYGSVLGGPNLKKSNPFHRWPPRTGPPRDDPQSCPVRIFFL